MDREGGRQGDMAEHSVLKFEKVQFGRSHNTAIVRFLNFKDVTYKTSIEDVFENYLNWITN